MQDELESFFHVLLYYAVRFLPHNLADQKVGRFLHEYFDGFSPDDEGYRCGEVKHNAMVKGFIDLRTYNGYEDPTRTSLKFLWPAPKPSPSAAPEERLSSPAPRSSPCPPEHNCSAPGSSAIHERSPSPFFEAIYGSDLTSLPSDDAIDGEPRQPQSVQQPQREHPINKIVSELLSWFKGYYSLDGETSDPGPPPTTEQEEEDTDDVIVGNKVRKIHENARVRQRRDAGRSSSGKQQIVKSTPQLSAEEKEKLAQLAKHLESHTPFIDLMDAALNEKWPANDKGVDKKPRGGYARPKSAVPSDTAHTGDKRRSMDDGPGDQARRSKRSKT